MRKLMGLLLLIVMASGLASAQTITSVLLPQCIEGLNVTNTNRIPYVYRVRLEGLTPDATYRYFNQIVISSDSPTSGGAGNCIFVSPTGDFYRSTGPSLSSSGNYDSLTTDGTGMYEGWFISEPTGNATRFIPGKYVFMRISLNDGAGGTAVATRLTTTDSVRVVKLLDQVTDSTGTGLRCTSEANPKSFVFVYDNTDGTGRPVSGTFVESDGTANTTGNSYSPFYANYVNGINGAFGMVLPNNLPYGIRRIEHRSLSDGSLIDHWEDSDGIWPSGTSTVNPSGGATEIVLAGSDMNHPPVSFALLEPTDGYRWVVSPLISDTLHFCWNRSMDPEGLPVYYSVEHDTTMTFDSPLFDYDTVGTDTTDVVLSQDVAGFLFSQGLDSATLYWRVVASDSTRMTYSNQTFSLNFVLAPNQPPSAFDLLEPANGYRWEVSLTSGDSLIGLWSRSVDPEGHTVKYYMEYDTTLAMNSPLHGIDTSRNGGLDTAIAVYSSREASYLNFLGLDSVTWYWRVLATDSGHNVYSNQTYSMKYVMKKQSAFPISALFVTDEDLGYGNAAYIRNALSGTGLIFDHFNAVDSARSPTFDEMKNYDLVIWYCSYDGVGNYFWNGADSDNDELIQYLNGGGNLWVTGTDLLYDRYGGPSRIFTDGEFPKDYLGISSYDVQSYGSDGGAGCPQLNRNSGQTICELDSFGWIYPTAWWIDGCTPVSGAVTVYKMGPAGYALAGAPTGIYYNNGTSKVLGFYFDTYEIDNDLHRDSVFTDVLQWFSDQITGVKDEPAPVIPKTTALYQNYPNPFNPTTTIKYDIKVPGKVTVKIYNTLGQEVRTLVHAKQNAGVYAITWDGKNNAGQAASSGIYICRLQIGNNIQSRKMMFLK